MSSLYLIRHGQAGTRWNYDALSDLGHQQAYLLGQYLAGQKIPFKALIAGCLNRQQQTAAAVRRAYSEAGLAVPDIVSDPGWNEFDMTAVFSEFAPLLSEAEHFKRCPLCGGYVDMRDRVWLEEHQQPLPHPACDRAQ